MGKDNRKEAQLERWHQLSLIFVIFPVLQLTGFLEALGGWNVPDPSKWKRPEV